MQMAYILILPTRKTFDDHKKTVIVIPTCATGASGNTNVHFLFCF
uniref:Uncharacterized protein n=1 Tax=Rhizophora mucronata TaxID=61149 RepID=A0A2P2PZ87_RHIMU